MMKIYNLGSLNIDYVYSVDHFVTAGETLSSAKMEIFPGGKGLNQSVALAKAGAEVIHGAIVGNQGEFLVETLKESGVNIQRIKKSDSTNGHAIIQVDNSGQNCILLYAGTNHDIDRNYIEEFLSDAQKDDIILLQNETSGLDIVFQIANQKQMQIVFNPSPFENSILDLPLSYVKWWFCNEIEGELLFGSNDPLKITENFIKKYPHSNLVLTLGKDGCIFKNKETFIKQAAFEAKAVDTTAAGDTFSGYFISMISQGKTIADALRIASMASAVTVSRKGASVSIPYINELETT